MQYLNNSAMTECTSYNRLSSGIILLLFACVKEHNRLEQINADMKKGKKYRCMQHFIKFYSPNKASKNITFHEG